MLMTRALCCVRLEGGTELALGEALHTTRARACDIAAVPTHEILNSIRIGEETAPATARGVGATNERVQRGGRAVSYTHLTLPTILLV